MSDYSPENAPNRSEAFNPANLEKILLGTETDITHLLTEVDGVDMQIARGSRTPNGIIRLQRSLFICEVNGIKEPDYLSVSDISKTTPLLGGQFYRVREERIPIDDNNVHPLMLDYSFRTSKAVDFVSTNSERVAYSKWAKFSISKKARPDLSRKFPFQNNIHTYIEDESLIQRAKGKTIQVYEEETDPLTKRKYRLEIKDADQLQQTVEKLLREFVYIV